MIVFFIFVVLLVKIFEGKDSRKPFKAPKMHSILLLFYESFEFFIACHNTIYAIRNAPNPEQQHRFQISNAGTFSRLLNFKKKSS